MPDEPPSFEPAKKLEQQAEVAPVEKLEKKATMTPKDKYIPPEEILDKVNQQLTLTKEEIDKNTAKKSDLEKEKAALEKEISDVSKIVEAYKKVFEKIKEAQTGLAEYYCNMSPIIVDTVTDLGKKEVIDKKIEEYNKETEELRQSLEIDGDLWTKYETAKTDFEKAQKAVKDALFEYNEWTKRQNEIEGDIKDIQILKSMIDKSDEFADAGKRYFWISEIKPINDALPAKIMDPEGSANNPGLHSKLDEKLSVLRDKNATLKENDYVLKTAETNYGDAQKTLESREKNRRNEILQIIKDL